MNVPPFYTTFLSVITAIEAEICKKIVIIKRPYWNPRWRPSDIFETDIIGILDHENVGIATIFMSLSLPGAEILDEIGCSWRPF